jgi:thioesterase domain-containing protein
MKPEGSAMTEALAPIWQRVLQLPSVDIHDDFFDLGGDSSLALQLFSEIGRLCGRELPPVTIYQARTIASLAALLDEPATHRFPALVQLRPGCKQPPVFLAHGLGGTVMDFFQPVRHIESDHPIYGLQAPGIDGVDEPLERIEDMADFYLYAVRELQPHGPYVLIGYSLGGLVALEMARRLRLSGEKIALLAMLDAYPHSSFLPHGEQARLFARRIKRGLHSAAKLKDSAAYQPPAGTTLTPAMQRVRDAAYRALCQYRPGSYAGEVKFVRAAVISSFPRDAAGVWGPFVQKLDVETVPGDHLGMIATYYEELASVLSCYLRQTFSAQEHA